MKRLSILASLAILLAGSAWAQQNERGLTITKRSETARVALVIGNSKYQSSPLLNPGNDARDIAASLQEMGFEVIARENLSQNDMKKAIREFGEKIRQGGVGLFYYAGHGVQVEGRNYLIPVDANIGHEQEVEYESVDVGFLLAQMENAKNTLNIVILDACRNNPFVRSFRTAKSGLAAVDAPGGTLIAYSTSPGSVASDGTGRNGIYTQALLKAMRTPGMKIEEVFKQVRIEVQQKTGGQQIPWELSSLIGDFYFGEAAARTAGPATKGGELPAKETSAKPNATTPPVGAPVNFAELLQRLATGQDRSTSVRDTSNYERVTRYRRYKMENGKEKTLDVREIVLSVNPSMTRNTGEQPKFIVISDTGRKNRQYPPPGGPRLGPYPRRGGPPPQGDGEPPPDQAQEKELFNGFHALWEVAMFPLTSARINHYEIKKLGEDKGRLLIRFTAKAEVTDMALANGTVEVDPLSGEVLKAHIERIQNLDKIMKNADKFKSLDLTVEYSSFDGGIRMPVTATGIGVSDLQIFQGNIQISLQERNHKAPLGKDQK
jgi:hypothetical protein